MTAESLEQIGREDGEHFRLSLLSQLQDIAHANGLDIGAFERAGTGAGAGYGYGRSGPSGYPGPGSSRGGRQQQAPTERYERYEAPTQKDQQPLSQPPTQSAPQSEAPKATEPFSAQPVDAQDQISQPTPEEGPDLSADNLPIQSRELAPVNEAGDLAPRPESPQPDRGMQGPRQPEGPPSNTGSDHDREVDDYLWNVYQNTKKVDKTGDYIWKDPAAAAKAGMTLRQFVVGGMSRELKERLYTTMKQTEAAGHKPELLAGFRDDYRQHLASGFKAGDKNSMHGGSRRTAGYGRGEAADVDPHTAAAIAKGQTPGLSRPMPGNDPQHVQISGKQHGRDLTSGAIDQSRDGDPQQAQQQGPQRQGEQQAPADKPRNAGPGSGINNTFYAPGASGARGMEGPFATSMPNPTTGKNLPTTLDDVRRAREEGRDIPVTLAGNPRRYGETHTYPRIKYRGDDGEMHTLDNVKGFVHDTGGAFHPTKRHPDPERGMNKLDIAATNARALGLNDKSASRHMMLNRVMPDAPAPAAVATPAAPPGVMPVARGQAAGPDPRGGTLGSRTDGGGIPEIEVKPKRNESGNDKVSEARGDDSGDRGRETPVATAREEKDSGDRDKQEHEDKVSKEKDDEK